MVAKNRASPKNSCQKYIFQNIREELDQLHPEILVAFKLLEYQCSFLRYNHQCPNHFTDLKVNRSRGPIKIMHMSDPTCSLFGDVGKTYGMLECHYNLSLFITTVYHFTRLFYSLAFKWIKLHHY